MSMQPYAVRTAGLSKSYARRPVVIDLDLQIPTGSVFALLGPNGAGKTTTVEILQGIRLRGGGTVSVLGEDPAAYSRKFRDRIGVVPQSTSAFDDLRVGELLGYFAAAYSRPLPVGRALALTGLTDKSKSLCRTLSGGQRRRVDIAVGLIGDPDLVFLDEPTTGLDPVARRHTWDAVQQLAAAGKTVLLTTHYLDEAEQLADTVGILIGGRLVDTGPPDTIGGRQRGEARVSFENDPRLRPDRLRLPSGCVREHRPGGTCIRTSEPTRVLRDLIEWARGCGLEELPGLKVGRQSLEDAYLAMISAADRAEVAA